LATAWHLKRQEPASRIVVLEQAVAACRGNSGRSAALFRNLFSSATSRDLAESSIFHYQQLAGAIAFKATGYLWHFSAEAWPQVQAAAEMLAREGEAVEILQAESSACGGLQPSPEGWPALGASLFGRSCGSLSAPALAAWYEKQFLALGGEVVYDCAVQELLPDRPSGRTADLPQQFSGVRDSKGQVWRAGQIIACTGCWLQDLLGPAGIASTVYSKKRQLFAISADQPEAIYGNSPEGSAYPVLILPYGGIYLKPVLARGLVVVGRADNLGRAFEQPYSLAAAQPEPEYFRVHIEPALQAYFPRWAAAHPDGFVVKQAWAGHYDYHWPDNNPVIEQQANLIWVGGSSGSGIMKADALGRVAAARVFGQEQAELADGRLFRVADLSLRQRAVAAEGLII